MNNDIIQRHNFSKSKKQIQQFSKKLPANPRFEEVDEDGGLFGWFDHNVTGKELNNFMGKVQNKLISVNDSLRGVIKEFGEVYSALDYLDNDYIQGILKAIENAEKASRQAVSASNQALKAQEDNSKTIEVLRKTVQAIKESKTIIPGLGEKVKRWESFQSRLEAIGHLDDVDTVWAQAQNNKRSIDSLSKDIGSWTEILVSQLDTAKGNLESVREQLDAIVHLKDIDRIWDKQKVQTEDIKLLQAKIEELVSNLKTLSVKHDDFARKTNADVLSLQKYISHVKSLKHLEDIDEVWDCVEKGKVALDVINDQLESLLKKQKYVTDELERKIKALNEYRNHLSAFKHINDIDDMWINLHNQSKSLVSLSSHLTEFQDNFFKFENDMKISLEQMLRQQDTNFLSLAKKIKIAYIIGGGALALSIISLIFQYYGVL